MMMSEFHEPVNCPARLVRALFAILLQSASPIKIWPRTLLIVEDCIVVVANLLPCFGKPWFELDGTLIAAQCLLQRVGACLWTKLDEIASHDQKTRRPRESTNCFVSKRNDLQ